MNNTDEIAYELAKEIESWSDDKLAAYRRVVCGEQERRLGKRKEERRNKFFAILKYLSIIDPSAIDHISLVYGFDETEYRYTSVDVEDVLEKLVIDEDGDVDTDNMEEELSGYSFDYDYVDETRPYFQVNFDSTTPEWVLDMFKELKYYHNYMEVYL